MSNILPFSERGPQAVIGNAHVADLETVIIIGWTKAGLFWTDASVKDGGDALWLIEKAKAKILESVG